MNKALKLLARTLILTGAASLAACSGNNDSDNSGSTTPVPVPSSTVSGVAAIGAAISNGSVALRCGDGINQTVTSGSDGTWTASVPTDSLPCAVKVSGGTVFGVENSAIFYSIARSNTGVASTSNLTPMTDLALASAVNSAMGSTLDVWYTDATDAQLQQVIDGLAAAVASLRTALADAGYTLPSESFDPFIDAITAGEETSLYDQLLDAYKQALSNAERSYEAARSDYIAGGDLPAVGPVQPPIIDVPDTTLAVGESGVRFATTGTVLGIAEKASVRTWSGSGSVTVGFTVATLVDARVSGPAINSYVNFRDIPDATGTYDCGYGFGEDKANIEIGFAASNGYNTLGTRGSDGTFTPGFRCSITLTKVGVNDGVTYSGTLEGNFSAQLYKSGQAVNTRDSISVTGHFRLGTE